MRQLILVTCILVTCIGSAFWSSMAASADVKVLSAGAVEPGLQRAAEQFKRASGHAIKMQFNTAPQLAKRMAEGEVVDILIAPPALLDEQARNGKISMQGRLALGRDHRDQAVRAKGRQIGRPAAAGHPELYELRRGAHKQCSFRGRGESISRVSCHAGCKTDFRSSGDRIGREVKTLHRMTRRSWPIRPK
jgi:hypothetical protein